MKNIVCAFLLFVAVISCKKDKDHHPLVGKWHGQKVVTYYKHPYTGTDTAATENFNTPDVEFRSNSEFVADNQYTGTYTFLTDSTYQRSNENFTWTIVEVSGSQLVIKRAGNTGDRLQFDDPSGNGMVNYAIPSMITFHYIRE